VSPPRAILSWSTGKDGAFALHEVRRLGLANVVGLLTTIDERLDRVAMHGTRRALLDAQVAALGLPLIEVRLPWPCPNATYEARMAEALAGIAADGLRHVIFGDLFLRDIRAYREARMAEAGMEAIFPLWGRDTGDLARAMIASGLEAHLVAVDPGALDPSFAGRRFDADFLADLPPGVDPCGENGEFHTAVTAGPMFGAPIAVRRGGTVTRDGFVHADLELA
jgi:uncharacterized protein (TIGR00290 family)